MRSQAGVFENMRSLIRLPSPVDLGWSEDNALMLREFTPYQEGKSWEDWHEHCRAHYPVRYFLAETIPRIIRQWIVWPVGRASNWVLDHCVPSRRYHLFDLRGIDPFSWYRHGYMDPAHLFWLAGWGALLRWHREGGSRQDPRSWMTPEEQAAPENQAQLDSYSELMALVHYWTVTRVEREECCSQLYSAVKAIAPTAENQSAYEVAKDEWFSYGRESERLEQEMWLRLAKMRAHLWS